MDNDINLKLVSATAVKDYMFCSMFFKLKYLYELPYMPGSIKEAFYYFYRSALLKFFHEVGLANKPLRKCISEAQELFVKKMRLALASFGKLDMSGEDMVAKGVLQLNEVHSLFAPQRDVIAAIDLPIVVDYKGVDIQYNLDVLVIENDAHSTRKFKVFGVADDYSDMALSNKHDGLHFGLMKKTLMDHFSTGRKGEGNFSQAQMEVIKVSGAKASISNSHHAPKPEFHLDPLIDTAIAGIDNGVFLPTAQAQKCKSCWFNNICSAKLCGPEVDPEKAASLHKKMSTKAVKTINNAAINSK